MKPAAFLDRDGTVIELVHHLTQPSRVRLIDGAAEAIRMLQGGGYACVLTSNQSVVGRGMLTEQGLRAINDELERQLEVCGAVLDGSYFCPVVPRQGDPTVVEHPDRKPGPGMLIRAAGELSLELSRSWMIGDSLSDMIAGRLAGCRGTVLVRSGYGCEIDPAHDAIDHFAEDLRAAADCIASIDRDD